MFNIVEPICCFPSEIKLMAHVNNVVAVNCILIKTLILLPIWFFNCIYFNYSSLDLDLVSRILNYSILFWIKTQSSVPHIYFLMDYLLRGAKPYDICKKSFSDSFSGKTGCQNIVGQHITHVFSYIK